MRHYEERINGNWFKTVYPAIALAETDKFIIIKTSTGDEYSYDKDNFRWLPESRVVRFQSAHPLVIARKIEEFWQSPNHSNIMIHSAGDDAGTVLVSAEELIK